MLQIGQAQEFIQTARKTQDYWMGSQLLSHLTREAQKLLAERGAEAIFPVNSLTRTTPIPNHCLVVLEADRDSEIRQLLSDAIKHVQEKWGQRASEVANAFQEKCGIDPSASKAFAAHWKTQVENAFGCMWVLREWDGTDTTYKSVYAALERDMGGRKSVRWWSWEYPAPPGGVQCSLCGSRLAIYDAHGTPTAPPKRSQVRDEWLTRFRKRGLQFKFREGEHLCAVCTVKRLATLPDLSTQSVPSTSSIAVADFLLALKAKTASGEVFDVKPFCDSLKSAKNDGWLSEPVEGSQLPFVQQSLKGTCLEQLANIEGDWLIDESYERNLDKNHQDKAAVLQTVLRNTVIAPAKKVLEPHEVPSKYFAVLAFDGDSMGKALSGIASKEKHVEFSQVVGEFADKHVRQAVEGKHAGFLAYAGGDEGLVFCSLGALLGIMQELRDAWTQHVEEPLRQRGFDTPPTLSTGTVIAHHQERLGKVIEEVFNALEYAKAYPDEKKDAFALAVMRRGNSPVRSRFHWSMDGVGAMLPHCLTLFIDAYQQDHLSARWLADMRVHESILGPVPDDTNKLDWAQRRDKVFRKESERIMMRHRGRTDDSKQKVRDLCGKLHALWGVATALSGEYKQGDDPFGAVMGLMDNVHYIAKGGGR